MAREQHKAQRREAAARHAEEGRARSGQAERIGPSILRPPASTRMPAPRSSTLRGVPGLELDSQAFFDRDQELDRREGVRAELEDVVLGADRSTPRTSATTSASACSCCCARRETGFVGSRPSAARRSVSRSTLPRWFLGMTSTGRKRRGS